MEFLVGLLIVVVILGAIRGGENFGDTVRKGCGFLLFLAILGMVVLLVLRESHKEVPVAGSDSALKELDSPAARGGALYEITAYEAICYSRPDIKYPTRMKYKKGDQFEADTNNSSRYFLKTIFNAGDEQIHRSVYILKSQARKKLN